MRPATKWLLAIFILMAFHMSISYSAYTIATSSQLTKYHNGGGLWNFALDSFHYHTVATKLESVLEKGFYDDWLHRNEPLHVKIISIAYYVFKPNPISFAPINAMAWTASVVGVFLLALLLMNGNKPRAMACALIYGLWPSSLALSTQLLKDPFYNLGCVAFVLGWANILSGKRSVLWITSGTLGFLLAVSIRGNQAPVLLTLVVLAFIFTAWKAREAVLSAFVALTLTIGVQIAPSIELAPATGILLADRWGAPAEIMGNAKEVKKFQNKKVNDVKALMKKEMGANYTNKLDHQITDWLYKRYSWYSPGITFAEKKRILVALQKRHGSDLTVVLEKWMSPWKYTSLVPDRIEHIIIEANKYRDSFLTYYLQPADSTKDSATIFRSVKDVLRYLPRAAIIGCFAPFPPDWLRARKAGGGAIGIVSGLEMLAVYFLFCGFIYFIAKASTAWHVKAWLVIFSAVMVLLLGLFVPNIGTLYRMRFIYLLPVIICGYEGLCLYMDKISGSLFRARGRV